MNTQEYLGEAFRIISENFHPNDPTGSMTVASVAYIVKCTVGDHREYGFLKFKDVLAILASQGRLRRRQLPLSPHPLSGATSERMPAMPLKEYIRNSSRHRQ